MDELRAAPMPVGPDRLWEIVLLLVGAWTAVLNYLWRRQDKRIADLEEQSRKAVTKADFDRAVEIRESHLDRLRETLEHKIDRYVDISREHLEELRADVREDVSKIHEKLDKMAARGPQA